MNKHKSDFRQIFGTLAPHAIVSRSELAELLNTTEGAVSQMIYRSELPKTAFPDKRRACWFVADIKFWLDEKLTRTSNEMTQDISQVSPTTLNRPKIGRPRSKIEHI